MADKILSYPRITVISAIMVVLASQAAYHKYLWFPIFISTFSLLIIFFLRIKPSAKSKAVVLLFVILCIPSLFYWIILERTPKPGACDLSHYAGRAVVFCAHVLSCQYSANMRSVRLILAPYMMIFPDRKPVTGQTALELHYPAQFYKTRSQLHFIDIKKFRTGTTLQIKGEAIELQEAEEPWQFNTKSYLAKNGIFSSFISDPKQIQIIQEPDLKIKQQALDFNGLSNSMGKRLEQLIDQCRGQIIQSHRLNMGNKEGDLLSSIVLGDRAVTLNNSIKKEFRDVGLSHILAASGFNLTIVVGITNWIARLCLPSIWLTNGISFVSIVLYSCLAGCSPSIMRAALMLSMLLTSRCLFRSVHALASLAVALLVTIVMDPSSITDIGLQLSYAATAGIITGARSLIDLGILVTGQKLFRWFLEVIAVVALAEASIIPLQLFYFWKMGLLFLPANILVDPLITPITILGFLSSIFALLQNLQYGEHLIWIGKSFDTCAYCLIKLILLITSCLASFDAAKLRFGPPTVWSIFIYYISLSVFIFALHVKRYRALAGACMMFCLGLLFWRPAISQLTIGIFPEKIAIFDNSRQGIILERVRADVLPKPSALSIIQTNNPAKKTFDSSYRNSLDSSTDKMLDRFLSYYGVNDVNNRHLLAQSLHTTGAMYVDSITTNLSLLFVDQTCNLVNLFEEIKVKHNEITDVKTGIHQGYPSSSGLIVFTGDKFYARKKLPTIHKYLSMIQNEIKAQSVIAILPKDRSYNQYQSTISNNKSIMMINGIKLACAQQNKIVRLSDYTLH